MRRLYDVKFAHDAKVVGLIRNSDEVEEMRGGQTDGVETTTAA